MKKVTEVMLDHISMQSKEFKKAPELFYALGFTGEANKKAMEPGDTAARFVFDNGYSETSLTKPEDQPFYGYLKGPSGMHCIAVRTPDAVAAAGKLEESGYKIAGVIDLNRANGTHGPKTGDIKFGLIPMLEDFVPNTHVSILEHRSRDLMYQSDKWVHDNGVNRFMGIVIACNDESKADSIIENFNKVQELTGEKSDGFTPSVFVCDTGTIEEDFGVRVDPERSSVVGIVYGTPELGKVKAILEKNPGLRYKEVEDRYIAVDAAEELNAALIFRKF